MGCELHTARHISAASTPAASASSTVLLPNSEIAISLQKEGAHSGPKESSMRLRKSEILIRCNLFAGAWIRKACSQLATLPVRETALG